MPEFFDAVEECRKEYYSDYKPELDRLRRERQEKSDASKKDSLDRLMKDMKTDDNEPIESDASEEEGETLDAQDVKGGGINITNTSAQTQAFDDGTSWPRP